MNSQKIIPHAKFKFGGCWKKEYENYSTYIQTLDLKEETIEWRLKHLRAFLDYLCEKRINLKKLNPTHIHKYLNSIENYSLRTKEHRAVCIRLFLDYLYEKKKLNFSGKKVLPIIKCYKDYSIVTNYSDEEISKILCSVDVKVQNGKRDYAMLCLLAFLGIRSKDLRELKLESLKWEENKIVFIQSKTGFLSSFPMIDQIRYSLLDYLKNERPNSNSEYVFIKSDGTTYSDGNMFNIVNKYFIKAGIDTTGKKHGPHAFRHSLGKSLLDQGKSFKTIGDTLGHYHYKDTEVYAKLDEVQLKKISLEVPTWKN